MPEDGKLSSYSPGRDRLQPLIAELRYGQGCKVAEIGLANRMSPDDLKLKAFLVAASLQGEDFLLVAVQEIANGLPFQAPSGNREFCLFDCPLFLLSPCNSIGVSAKGFGKGGIAFDTDLSLPAGASFADSSHDAPCHCGVAVAD
jgi:hypothetical protein